MSYKFILYDVSDNVATITLNRPDRKNALTPALLGEMTKAISSAQGDGARTIVLTGAGDAFCSGADLRPDSEGYDGLPDDLGELLEKHYVPVIKAIEGCDIPVISKVRGLAVGAGLGFALAADIVIMERSAYFMLAFANIGLVPDAGATWLVAKSAGRAKALEMALLGEKISAEQALDYGLVTRVVDDADLDGETQKIAAKFANGPTKALGMIRKQVAAALDDSLAETLKLELANQRTAGRTADFREAVAAFGEKRKPEFKGE